MDAVGFVIVISATALVVWVLTAADPRARAKARIEVAPDAAEDLHDTRV